MGSRDNNITITLTTRVDAANLLEPNILGMLQENKAKIVAAVQSNAATSPAAPRIRSYDRATHKKCIRCREVLPKERFGDHNSADGKQSICFDCKNKRGKQLREINVRARLRHHISTRVISQLGHLCPEGVTRDLEQYLGYSFAVLVRHLADRLKKDYPDKKLVQVLQDGWHVDHLYPLSRYKVVDEPANRIDWEEFRRCWDPNNLAAIPAEDNLKKGAKIVDLSEYRIDEENPI
jgi:hypothetical protein